MSVPSSEQAISHVHSGPFRGTPAAQPVPDAGTQSIEDPTLVPTALLVSLRTWAWEQLL